MSPLRTFLLLVPLSLALAIPGAALAQETTDEDDPIVVISGDVTVAEDETVDDGVFVVHGDVVIDGIVDGDVFVIDGTVEVNGEITGDLTTIDDEPVIGTDATIGGDVNSEDWTDWEGAWWIGPLALWLAITFSTLFLGLLLLLIAPRAADAAYLQARDRPWESVAMGFGIFVLLPILAVVALITLVGLPLGIALLLALVPLMAIAYTTTCWLLGGRVLGPPRSRFVSFLVGWAILRAVALIPVLGLLVWLGATIFGLGVLGLALWRARTTAAPPSAPPPAATTTPA
jgi:hypothetical protein